MFKKALAFILAVVMIVSLLPMAAFADTVETGTQEVNSADTLIAALANGGKIKLTGNISSCPTLTVSKDTEIDFNGNKITFALTVNNNSQCFLVNNGVNFNITDSSATPGGVVTTYSNSNWATTFVKNEGGTVTFDKINVSGPSLKGVIQTAGKFIMNGGAMNVTHFGMHISAGSVEIKSGTLASNSGNSQETIYLLGGTSLNVTGGEITSTKSHTISVAGQTAETTVTISGGSIKHTDSATNTNNVFLAGTNCTVNITGGSFENAGTGDNISVAVETAAEKVSITGGEFDVIPADDFIAVGAEITVGDKTYTKTESGEVEEFVAVAKIGDKEFSSLADAIAAAAAEQTVEIVAAGTYTMPSLPAGVTVKGVDGVVLDCSKSGKIASLSTATFENVAIMFGAQTAGFGGNGNYHGFHGSSALTFNNCDFYGEIWTYAETFICNNCNFYQQKVDGTNLYSLYVYGSDLVKLTNCTFDVQGKAVKIAKDGDSAPVTVIADNCVFTSSIVNKPAIMYDARYSQITVIANECTFNENFTSKDCEGGTGMPFWDEYYEGGSAKFPSATAVGKDIVLDKNNKVIGGTFTVLEATTVEGEDGIDALIPVGYEIVKNEDNTFGVDTIKVAKIGDNLYTSINEALAAAEAAGEDTVITILCDVTEKIAKRYDFGSCNVTITADEPVVVDFDNYADTNCGIAVTNGKNLTIGEKVTIKGINFVGMRHANAGSVDIYGKLYLHFLRANSDNTETKSYVYIHKGGEVYDVTTGTCQMNIEGYVEATIEGTETSYTTIRLETRGDKVLTFKDAKFLAYSGIWASKGDYDPNGAKIDVVLDNSVVDVDHMFNINTEAGEFNSTLTLKNRSTLNLYNNCATAFRSTDVINVEPGSKIVVTQNATFTNNGTIKVDMTGVTEGSYTIVDFNGKGTPAYGTCTVVGNEDYKLVVNEDNDLVAVPKSYVAQIGTQKFESINDAFAAAVAAAEENDNITVAILSDVSEELTSDYLFSKNVTITADSAVTVDLKNSGSGKYLNVNDGATLTIGENVTVKNAFSIGPDEHNGTLVINGTIDNARWIRAYGSKTDNTGSANVIINSTGKVINPKDGEGNYFRTKMNGTITINGSLESTASVSDADYQVVGYQLNADGTTDGGFVLNNAAVHLTRIQNNPNAFDVTLDNSCLKLDRGSEASADFKLTGALTLKNGSKLVYSDSTSAFTVESTGVISVDNGSSIEARTFTNNGKITVDMTGATGSVTVIDYTGNGTMTLASYGKVEVTGGKFVAKVDENNDLVIVPAVAKMGDIYYASLAEAIDAYNAAPAGTAAAPIDYIITVEAGVYEVSPMTIKQAVGKTLTITGSPAAQPKLLKAKLGAAPSGLGTTLKLVVDNGSIFNISGASSYSTGATIIKNLILDISIASSKTVSVVSSMSGNADRYASYVTVESCKLIGLCDDNHIAISGPGGTNPEAFALLNSETVNMGRVVQGYFSNVNTNAAYAMKISGCEFGGDTMVVYNGQTNAGSVDVITGNTVESLVSDYAFRSFGGSMELKENNVTTNFKGEVESGKGVVVMRNNEGVIEAKDNSFDAKEGTTELPAVASDKAPITVKDTEGNVMQVIEANKTAEVIELDPVATIGAAKYYSLAEAVKAAQDGDTIDVIASCSIDSVIEIKADNVTIQGKAPVKLFAAKNLTAGSTSSITITGLGTAAYSGFIVYGDNVTFKDLTITSCRCNEEYKAAIYYTRQGEGSVMTVINCTINDTRVGVDVEDNISDGCKLIINGCDLDATYPFHVGTGKVEVTVNGSALHGWTSYGDETKSVTFTNCEFSKGTTGYDNVASYANTKFDDCEFDNSFDLYARTTGYQWELVDCTKGGTPVTAENMAELGFSDSNVWTKCLTTVNEVPIKHTDLSLDAGIVYNTDPTAWLSGDVVAKKNADGSYSVVEAVAEVNGVKYETLEEAINAAGANDTVKLLADVKDLGNVSLKPGMILDGNGKTVSGATAIYISKDGGTVTNVNFKNIHNGKNQQSAIISESLVGTATITNCTFTDCDWDAIQIIPKAGSAIVITDNTFSDGTTDGIQQQRFVHIQSDKNVDFDATVTGNKMIGSTNQGALEAYYFTEESDIELSGNYIEDTSNVCILSGNGVNAAEEILPLVEEDLSTEITYVAMIKDAYCVQLFTSLADAMNAANAGDTVELLCDVDLSGSNWTPVSFSGTFDGHGFTISNMTVNDTVSFAAGFFSKLNGTVKNVTFEKANVTANRGGIVVGETGTDALVIDNVKVTNSVFTGDQKCAALLGFAAGAQQYGCKSITVKNCSVDGMTFKNLKPDGIWQSGAVIGYVMNGADVTVTGNDVKNVSFDKDAHFGEATFNPYYASHAFIGTVVNDTKIKGVTCFTFDQYTINISGNTTEQTETARSDEKMSTEFFGGFYNFYDGSGVAPTKIILDGELLTDELKLTKERAVAELAKYVDELALTNTAAAEAIVANGNTAISAADTVAKVNTALAAAKAEADFQVIKEAAIAGLYSDNAEQMTAKVKDIIETAEAKINALKAADGKVEADVVEIVNTAEANIAKALEEGNTCNYKQYINAPANGAYNLELGGKYAGTYTFEKSGDGWNIKSSDSKWVSFDGSKVTTSSTPYTWKYDGGFFTTVTTTTPASSGNFFTRIINSILNMFGMGRGGGSTTTETNYYLAANDSGLTASKSTKVAAKLYTNEVAFDHALGDWHYNGNGTHSATCSRCGETVTMFCNVFEGECTVCHNRPGEPVTPPATDVKITINWNPVYSGWWIFKTVDYYLTNISVTNGTVIAYSIDTKGILWLPGSTVMSQHIEDLYVTVLDNNGGLHVFFFNRLTGRTTEVFNVNPFRG